MKKIKKHGACSLIGIVLFLGSTVQLTAQTWSTTGNAGTGSSNFIGTTDAMDFRIRSNNTERMFFGSGGFVGIGTSTSIGNANFVLSGTNGGWSGMYTNASLNTSRPFYGYSVAGTPTAWTYYDPSRSAWIANVGNADRMFINTSGNVGIGTTSPGAKLDVAGDLHSNGNVEFGGAATDPNIRLKVVTTGNQDGIGIFGISGNGMTVSAQGTGIIVSGGEIGLFSNANRAGFTNFGAQITATTSSNSLLTYGVFASVDVPAANTFGYALVCNGTGYYTGNWYQLSDQRFKKNVSGLNGALDIVKQLQPKTYEYKRDEYGYMNFPAGQQYGFIAQDVEKVAPFLVKETEQPVDIKKPEGEKVDFKMVNYIGLIPVLTEAIQEQQTIIDQLDSLIQEQNDRLTRLESQVNQLSSGTTGPKSNGTIQLNQLYPNQPNPFSQETTIKYTIDNAASTAVIVIMDMQGTIQKSVALTQKGDGSITVQAQDLKPGLYTYELIVDGKIADSKKMVITK